jgi:hypothetical protein
MSMMTIGAPQCRHTKVGDMASGDASSLALMTAGACSSTRSRQVCPPHRIGEQAVVADAVEAAGQHVQQEAEFPQERTPKAEPERAAAPAAKRKRAFDIDDAAFTAALNESKQRRRRSLRNRLF